MPNKPRIAKLARTSQPNSLLRSFQSRLEALRSEAGLSRRAFADHLGIPRSSFFHLMSETGNPSLDTIELIAERIGVDPLALFPGADNKQRSRATSAAPTRSPQLAKPQSSR